MMSMMNKLMMNEYGHGDDYDYDEYDDANDVVLVMMTMMVLLMMIIPSPLLS